MNFAVHVQGAARFMEITGGLVLDGGQAALELIMNLREHGFDAAIVSSACLPPDFYRLRTGVAGEVLQKLATYRARIAFIGDFEAVAGASFRALVAESNRGDVTCFVASMDQALDWLARHG